MKNLTVQKLSSLLLFILFISVTSSCEKASRPNQFQTNIGGDMVLGEQLENPYSISNMQIALENLLQDNKTISDFEVETTDLYVRFLPNTIEEYELLIQDSLELFDYPLDYEIIEFGEYYQDPEIPSNEQTWLYTVVPVNYTFVNVEYEILEELFLPDSYEEGEKSSQNMKEFLMTLEDEALKITGNLELDKGSKLAPKKPKGYIKVKDTDFNTLVPVKKVKVRVRRWFVIETDYTDLQGFYKIDHGFRRDVNYSIVFENQTGFKIWGNYAFLTPARHSFGSHSPEGADFNSYQTSVSWKWLSVNNGLYEYREYCDLFAMAKPPSNMRIWVNELNNPGNSGATPMLRRTFGWFNFNTNNQVLSFLVSMNLGLEITANIVVNVMSFVEPDMILNINTGSSSSQGVFRLACHESAHATHWVNAGNSYWVKYINYIIHNFGYGTGEGENAGICLLGEAWANHIGYYLALDKYGEDCFHDLQWFENYTPLQVGNEDEDEFWTWSGWSGWMPIGIMHDLIDSNVDFIRYGKGGYYYDNVQGYSHENLYNALDSDVESPAQFKDRLLEENNNLDINDVEDLFKAYYVH
jgi:hypothetical protein